MTAEELAAKPARERVSVKEAYADIMRRYPITMAALAEAERREAIEAGAHREGEGK